MSDPVESAIREALDKWPVGQAAAVAAHLRAAGLLRDEAREARMREALEETRAYLDGLADDEADEHLMPLIRAALEDKR